MRAKNYWRGICCSECEPARSLFQRLELEKAPVISIVLRYVARNAAQSGHALRWASKVARFARRGSTQITIDRSHLLNAVERLREAFSRREPMANCSMPATRSIA